MKDLLKLLVLAIVFSAPIGAALAQHEGSDYAKSTLSDRDNGEDDGDAGSGGGGDGDD